MSFNRNNTLEQLEGRELGEPDYGSCLVQKAHKLYKRPLSMFTAEDLRLMIGQELGLPFLIPLAIEALEKEPLIAGDYHAGDLLLAVLRVSRDFWKEHQDLYWRLCEVISDLPTILGELKESIEKFQSQ